MKTKVKVAKCTASSNGGFILTLLAAAQVAGLFGGVRTIEKKLFLKSEVDVPLGTEAEIDLSQFTVTVVEDVYEGKPVSKTWIKERTDLAVINQVATRIKGATVVGGVGAF